MSQVDSARWPRVGETLRVQRNVSRILEGKPSHAVFIKEGRATLAVMRRTLFAALRTAIGVPVFFVFTLLLATYIVIVAAFRPHHPYIDSVIRFWGRRFLNVGGLSVSAEGTDRIDPDRQYVFVANHLSNFDIPVLFSRVPHRIRFLAKKEVYKIPMVGMAMRRVGMVKVDRDAGHNVHAAINEGIKDAQARGYSLIIFPEGTRSRDGELHIFKKGAFRIAIANGMDVVPITIHGTWEAWPPGARMFYPGKVRMVMHDPISVGGSDLTDIGKVRDQAHEVISAAWNTLRVS
jgi:1-acyl-sn-glycerol-3-phosphate acyltransferase